MKRHRSDSISSSSSDSSSSARHHHDGDIPGIDDSDDDRNIATRRSEKHSNGDGGGQDDDTDWRRGQGPSKWTRLTDDFILNQQVDAKHQGTTKGDAAGGVGGGVGGGWKWVCTLPPSCNKLIDHDPHLGPEHVQTTYGIEFETEEQLARHHERCHVWVCRCPDRRGRMGGGREELEGRILNDGADEMELGTFDNGTKSSAGLEDHNQGTDEKIGGQAPSGSSVMEDKAADQHKAAEDNVVEGEAEECGKVFPDKRMLDLVSVCRHLHLHEVYSESADGLSLHYLFFFFPTSTHDSGPLDLCFICHFAAHLREPRSSAGDEAGSGRKGGESFAACARPKRAEADLLCFIYSPSPVRLTSRELLLDICPSKLSLFQFQCFEPPSLCTKRFRHPKSRRNHLIHTHGYPARYFFAVVNKGIGGLIERYGPGASLLRPQWKPSRSVGGGDARRSLSRRGGDPDADDGQASNAREDCGTANGRSIDASNGGEPDDAMDVDLEGLTSAMAKSSLEFVPPSIRKKKNKEKGRVAGASQGQESMVVT